MLEQSQADSESNPSTFHSRIVISKMLAIVSRPPTNGLEDWDSQPWLTVNNPEHRDTAGAQQWVLLSCLKFFQRFRITLIQTPFQTWLIVNCNCQETIILSFWSPISLFSFCCLQGVGRRVMEKQGWKEGKGLGSSKEGIKDALNNDGQKPGDKRGLGWEG